MHPGPPSNPCAGCRVARVKAKPPSTPLVRRYNAVIEDATNRYAIDFARLVSTVQLGNVEGAEFPMRSKTLSYAQSHSVVPAGGQEAHRKIRYKVAPEQLNDLSEFTVSNNKSTSF